MRLRRSDINRPGITRLPHGRGYSYRDPAGRLVVERDVRDRIAHLVIPPAWQEVWICPYPNGHIQATGIDTAGRRQYLYHPVWEARRAQAKFVRARALAEALPAARASVTRDLAETAPSRRRTLAVAFRLLDSAAPRLGSLTYLRTYGSHGLSTLLCSHVRVADDVVVLEFPAKSGQLWSSQTHDPVLAAALEPMLHRGPRQRLLAWQESDGWHVLAPEEVNDDIRARTHGDFTAKDFRTLHGTVTAAVSLARSGPQASRIAQHRAVREAARAAALELNNTPSTALKAYIDPLLVEAYREGRTIDLSAGAKPEHALTALLENEEGSGSLSAV